MRQELRGLREGQEHHTEAVQIRRFEAVSAYLQRDNVEVLLGVQQPS